MTRNFLILLMLFTLSANAFALERPEIEFKVFHFPANMIPRIDGNTDDWYIVGDDYTIGTDQLSDTQKGQGTNINTKDIDVNVRVGWVNGYNRLYFLYEAYDEFWDFEENIRPVDIFEIVVDGDLSGGLLIKQMNPNADLISESDLHFLFHGVHAQNYHIFTPPGNKDWAFVWGAAQYINDLPYANHAYSYDFQKDGDSGHLVLEFWITAFDFAPYNAPDKAIESDFYENKLIGLSWSVLDYDGPTDYEGFYNLSHKTTMYGNASELCAFRLMPIEKQFLKPIDAKWTYKIVDMDSRTVAFKGLSYGNITSWNWDFGDGTISTEQNPIHRYEEAGEKIVTLTVAGPGETDEFCRLRDLFLK